jgi:hypothetical protein
MSVPKIIEERCTCQPLPGNHREDNSWHMAGLCHCPCQACKAAQDAADSTAREQYLDKLGAQAAPLWAAFDAAEQEAWEAEQERLHDQLMAVAARVEARQHPVQAVGLLSLADRVQSLAQDGFLGSKAQLAQALGWPGSVQTLNHALTKISGDLLARRVLMEKTGDRCGPNRLEEWSVTVIT